MVVDIFRHKFYENEGNVCVNRNLNGFEINNFSYALAGKK